MARPRVKKDGVHAHGCVACKTRFEDACDKPTEWPKCADCRTGRPVLNPLLIANRSPIACCRQHTRLCRKDELESYRLFQTCDWFICTTCKRTFPFRNPKDTYV